MGSDASLGLYITALRDFDAADGSFGMEYWVRSIRPQAQGTLEDLNFVNAKRVDPSPDELSLVDGIHTAAMASIFIATLAA